MSPSGKWRAAALIWGFAEATLFFTVPDVLLTLAVVRIGWRRALGLMPLVLIGALVGGAAMYGLAYVGPEVARATVVSVPLISEAMVMTAREAMAADWLTNMIVGSFTGTPYKVYAVIAPGAEVSLGAFLLGSIVARPLRWALVLGFAALVMAGLTRWGFERFGFALWAALWIAFYIIYYIILGQV